MAAGGDWALRQSRRVTMKAWYMDPRPGLPAWRKELARFHSNLDFLVNPRSVPPGMITMILCPSRVLRESLVSRPRLTTLDLAPSHSSQLLRTPAVISTI